MQKSGTFSPLLHHHPFHPTWSTTGALSLTSLNPPSSSPTASSLVDTVVITQFLQQQPNLSLCLRLSPPPICSSVCSQWNFLKYMPWLKTLHFPSPSGPSLNRYPEASLLIPVSLHLVFSLLGVCVCVLGVGGGWSLSPGPSILPLSFRTQWEHQETLPDPHPLTQVWAGSSSWGFQWHCRLPFK